MDPEDVAASGIFRRGLKIVATAIEAPMPPKK
jgi:hypothetical protein